MKILILGTSGTAGSALPDREKGLAALLGARLQPSFGEVTVVHRVFHPNGPKALRFLEKVLDQESPDIVIGQPSTFPFTIHDVSFAIRDRFGDRAQNAFDRTEGAFRHVALRSGGAGKLTDAGAKAIARRLFGRAPMLDEAVGLETWCEAIDVLARHEEIQSFIFAPFKQCSAYIAMYPEAGHIRDRLTDAFQARAEQRHLGWIDVEPAMDEAPGGRDSCYLPDMVHRNDQGHQITLEGTVRVLLAGRLD